MDLSNPRKSKFQSWCSPMICRITGVECTAIRGIEDHRHLALVLPLPFHAVISESIRLQIPWTCTFGNIINLMDSLTKQLFKKLNLFMAFFLRTQPLWGCPFHAQLLYYQLVPIILFSCRVLDCIGRGIPRVLWDLVVCLGQEWAI